jgi:isopentenyl diphosphate isomerase/L-lactate dehydrogenase-like FMN-dependent dehydrogenase
MTPSVPAGTSAVSDVGAAVGTGVAAVCVSAPGVGLTTGLGTGLPVKSPNGVVGVAVGCVAIVVSLDMGVGVETTTTALVAAVVATGVTSLGVGL